MELYERKSNLSQIETSWSLVLQAHQIEGDAAAAAKREMMERYAGAVMRYLICVTQDADAAADLTQEFALRFLRGDFHRANPQRGRFRDYVKSAVLNLVADAHRRQKIRPRPLPEEGFAIAAPEQDPAGLDRQFLECWRDELLSRAWERLVVHERTSGQPFYTVLRYRADFPKLRSHEIAIELGKTLNRPLTAVWVRQTLRRARARFVELLKDEVSRSLGESTAADRVEEMQLLGLWEYCRDRRDPKPIDGDVDRRQPAETDTA